MRGARGFGNALAAAILSIGLTFGALSISLVGFIPEAAPASTATPIFSPIPVTATNTSPPTSTAMPSAETATPAATNTVIPSANCPPPPGWTTIIVQAGDTLDSLAAKYGVTAESLKSANCLVSEYLIAGTSLNAPNQPTHTSAPCVPGSANWIKNYTVVFGDTLFSIATRYYTTVAEMKRVNCHPNDEIRPGDLLWVPKATPQAPTLTPISVFPVTITPTLTEPVTLTPLPFTMTPLPTQTQVVVTSTPIATATPIPTQTATLTALPSSTATP